MTVRRMSRAAGGLGPPAPVRMLHLGLGNFFRAHPAWYTARAGDGSGWGIAAFTGRRPDLADALRAQDGAYTLITRGPVDDEVTVVGSLSAVHAAAEHRAWLGYCADPDVAVISTTVTEAGYHRTADGSLDSDDPAVRADVAALQLDPRTSVTTAPARLAAGLLARAGAGAGAQAVTIVPCDNLPDNGAAVARVVREFAAAISPEAAAAVNRLARFVSTMVDRITPRSSGADRALVAGRTGIEDACPVVTEPFHEWVLAGDFPSGRPLWESAGARFVPDAAPHERRKLWLLNGSHSLLAYAGSISGHRSVAEAIADPVCREWVEQWWDEASGHLGLPMPEVAGYRAALLDRYANPRIEHLLAQIAADGSQKIPLRILPVLRAERAHGRPATAAARAVAAWVCHLRGLGAPVADEHADRWVELAGGPLPDAVPRVLRGLGTDLADDAHLAGTVTAVARDLAARVPG
jgi:fructuronate reductase